MDMMEVRRRVLLHQAKSEDIPIGVELFDYDAEDNVFGNYLWKATIGSDELVYASNSRNFTTGFMPFDSRYDFSFTGSSGSGSASGVLCDENYVVYYVQSASNMAKNMKRYALSAEAQYGIKIKWVKITCTTDNYNNHAISYKRIS